MELDLLVALLLNSLFRRRIIIQLIVAVERVLVSERWELAVLRFLFEWLLEPPAWQILLLNIGGLGSCFIRSIISWFALIC